MTTNEHPESHSPSSAAGDMPPPCLFFNTLPFSYPQTEAEINFTTTHQKGSYRFIPDQVPRAVLDKMPRGTRHEWIYSRAVSGGPGFSLKVKLSEYPALARVWCSQRIRELLAPQVAYSYPVDSSTTEFWCRDPENLPCPESIAAAFGESEVWQAFHRITVRVYHPADASHPELLIGYNGMGCILLFNQQGFDNLNIDTRVMGHVAFRGRIYPYKNLPEEANYHPAEVIPLLKGKLMKWLNLEHIVERIRDTPVSSYPLIKNFIKTYCLTDPFKAVVPHDGRFRGSAPSDSGRVPAADSRLLFGEGGRSSCPVEGTTTYGPLQRPAGLHFSCFFIFFEQDLRQASELLSWFVNTTEHMRLGRFMRLSVKCSHDHDIRLSDDGDPEQQVVRRLEEMVFSREVIYCALFIRPSERLVNGGSRRRLHSRIMELLLHRGVLVQQVNAAELKADFIKPSRTLGFDLVARMGGTPWRPEGNGQSDPVVGFALHKSGDLPGPDSGAAVFFSPGGLFAGANIFDPADELSWGGLSMEFFQKWDNGFREVRRLVIHCERPLKAGELESLKRMVEEVKPGLQVAVMAVRRCRSRDLQAFDSSAADGLPAGGTWVRCNNHRYLLYTAGRVRDTTSSPGQAIPLSIRFQLINAGEAVVEDVAPELLNQLYCFTLMHPPSSARHPLPVTLTYPALLARRMPLFRGKALPEFGRNFPWFL